MAGQFRAQHDNLAQAEATARADIDHLPQRAPARAACRRKPRPLHRQNLRPQVAQFHHRQPPGEMSDNFRYQELLCLADTGVVERPDNSDRQALTPQARHMPMASLLTA